MVLLISLVLISSVVIAAGPKTGQQVQSQTQTQTIQQVKARNTSELREMIQERETEMEQEMVNFTETNKNIYQNQNRVRLAVHSLLAMENLTGGIGQNISQIAREFNNSVQATIRAEERIQTRNAIVRFFVGGDEEAAEEIEQEVNQNRLRIQQLTQLRNDCNCSEEIKTMIQEQTQNMEQEQTRLEQLAQNEKQNKGLFGWFFAWFRR